MEILEMVSQPHSLWRVRTALSGLQDALATDHYALQIDDVTDKRLAITIRALAGACEECLISPEIISNLIRTQVPSDFTACAIDLHLDVPAEWGRVI